jgi:putative membrane protein
MKKTLILVVDRDDDFGVKGGVESPVIGVQDCSVAATALGIADPEDSDINALYAAINIYKDLHNDRNSNVEVALICGNQKVGYRSDAAIVEELEEVLDKVKPDRIILVGDGAEDEYVYPIISSRIQIDSVRKVYVKQAPGIEGTVYILSKILSDPAKKKRFLAPVGWVIVLISLVYLIPGLFSVYTGDSELFSITTPLVVFLIGFFFMLYAYNIPDWISKWQKKWMGRFRSGSVSVTFTMVSIILMAAGVVYGYFALDTIYIYRISQTIIWYIYSVMWFIIFGMMIYIVGDMLDSYLRNNTIKISHFTSCINLAALGLIGMGTLDILLNYLSIGVVNPTTYTFEIATGILIAFIGAAILRYIKQFYIRDNRPDENAIQ